MKYCSKHHKNLDNAVFCSECGERLITAQRSTKKCPICNAENPKDAEYCHACGGHMFEEPVKSPPLNEYSNTSSNDEIGLVGWIVMGLIAVVAIGCVAGTIGEFFDLLKLLVHIFN